MAWPSFATTDRTRDTAGVHNNVMHRDAVRPLMVPMEAPEAPSAAARRRRPLAASSLVHGRSTIAINHGSTFLVADGDGSIHSESGSEQGLYADDTRFVSTHLLQLNGRPLQCIANSRLSFRHARWTLVAPDIASVTGNVTDARVTVTVDRIISARRLHEDIVVRAYGREPVSLLLSLRLTSDFADLFEVRTERWQRRTRMSTSWLPPAHLDTRYNRNGFLRRCLVRMTPPS